MTNHHEPGVVLDRQSPNYAAGVEIGMLYQHLKTESLPLHAIVHANNAEMVIRLAEAFNASARSNDLDHDLLSVTFA